VKLYPVTGEDGQQLLLTKARTEVCRHLSLLADVTIDPPKITCAVCEKEVTVAEAQRILDRRTIP